MNNLFFQWSGVRKSRKRADKVIIVCGCYFRNNLFRFRRNRAKLPEIYGEYPIHAVEETPKI